MSDTISLVGDLLARIAAGPPGDSTVADVRRLAAGRASAIDDRYRDAIGQILVDVASGELDPADSRAVRRVYRAISSARRYCARQAAKRRGSATREAVSYPDRDWPIRIVWRGVPCGPVGDPSVRTCGSPGYAPDQYALTRSHDHAARVIDAMRRSDRHRDRYSPRDRGCVVSVVSGPTGTYHARPGKRRRRKR